MSKSLEVLLGVTSAELSALPAGARQCVRAFLQEVVRLHAQRRRQRGRSRAQAARSRAASRHHVPLSP